MASTLPRRPPKTQQGIPKNDDRTPDSAKQQRVHAIYDPDKRDKAEKTNKKRATQF